MASPGTGLPSLSTPTDTGTVLENGSWAWAAWLDSYEGLPQPRSARGTTARFGKVHHWLEQGAVAAPGVILAAALAVSAVYFAEWFGQDILGFDKTPIASIPVAVLAGAAMRTAIGLPRQYDAGLRLCVRFLLRLGIVLLGLRLSLAAIGTIGRDALPGIMVCISAAMIVSIALARALRLSDRQGYLIAAGTGICGVSAIAAVAPVVRANEDEVSYSIGCITVFGMAAMLCYPPLAHWLFGADARMAGYFLGTSIHDTAQVAGAALIFRNHYQVPEALDFATVTKLVRNTMMVVIIPLLGFLTSRNAVGTEKVTLRWANVIPFFVVGYLGLGAMRTIGDLGSRPFLLFDATDWNTALHTADTASGWLLGIAMASVGLGTDFKRLKTLGWRPMILGLSTALAVGGASLVMVLATPPR